MRQTRLMMAVMPRAITVDIHHGINRMIFPIVTFAVAGVIAGVVANKHKNIKLNPEL